MPDARTPATVPFLERKDLPPVARGRLGWVVSALLGTGLAAIAAIGMLAIWHLVRRGRLIRERLGPPKAVRLPDPEPGPSDPSPPPPS